ncbi:RlpA-like double-psi beta-barrel-protein domain-containing protein-containing protein [Russula ochroleuca]|uniref:RlpA-like double-psi beta-barrel-protein domain-containing protein-containing protein n=1 Tax=Russula ochroleuca TaxID=152965 RepID=A0A9P5MQC0_9AGAM|nr:RlpA-like double-psi beta-barrel-protein domain-containing protein-containing protein [Russula ochroleuca]
MYKFTVVLFAFSSLVLPILAIPAPAPASEESQVTHYTGTVIEYHPPSGLGGCGDTNDDNDQVVAISADRFDGGAHCNTQVQIKYNGLTVNPKIVDSCPAGTCGKDDFEASPAVFKALGAQGTVIGVEWNFD